MQDHYLSKYNPVRQAWGDILSEVHWSAYGCGTFRTPACEERAIASTKLFLRIVGKHFNIRLYYFFMVEGRPSGLNLAPIGRHVHFLLAAPPCINQEIVAFAQHVWSLRNGDAKIDEYDPSRDGASYTSKLIERDSYYDFNLPHHRPPIDSTDVARRAMYVPHHARGLSRTETLVFRHRLTKAPLAPRKVSDA